MQQSPLETVSTSRNTIQAELIGINPVAGAIGLPHGFSKRDVQTGSSSVAPKHRYHTPQQKKDKDEPE